MKKIELPNIIPILPLSNFIIFPETTVPLNIFEPRYIEMIDDCMKKNRMIGMVQPKKTKKNSIPNLYNVGCVGKIVSFNETEDGRYLIILNGICRFKIINEIENNKLYRECNVDFNLFEKDLNLSEEKIQLYDLKLILNDLKILFKKKSHKINWSELEKQTFEKTINSLAMVSPFSLEEKQILLEAENLKKRKNKLEEILNTYSPDHLNNNTIQ